MSTISIQNQNQGNAASIPLQKRSNQGIGFEEGMRISEITTALVGAASSRVLVPRMTKENVLNSDTIELVNKAAQKALGTSKLGEKGVEIIRVLEDGSNKGIVYKTLSGGKGLGNATLKSQAERLENTLRKGANAFFESGSNKVFMPEKKLSLAVFHEMGHGLNYNFSKIGKLLQKMRGVSMIAPLALTYAALSAPYKAKVLTKEEKKQLNPIDRVKVFLKENAGKLCALAYAPIVAEEALASIKGNKLAAQTLTKELAKKVKMNNFWALGTYIAAGIATGLGAMLAVKTKDQIQKGYDKNNTGRFTQMFQQNLMHRSM
jgi:hypothetical protein